jgi:hypothetical protein
MFDREEWRRAVPFRLIRSEDQWTPTAEPPACKYAEDDHRAHYGRVERVAHFRERLLADALNLERDATRVRNRERTPGIGKASDSLSVHRWPTRNDGPSARCEMELERS